MSLILESYMTLYSTMVPRVQLAKYKYFDYFGLCKTPKLTPQWIWLDSLQSIGNSFGPFVKIESDKIANGIISFFYTCAEIDLSAGLLDKIILKCDSEEILQPVD